VWPARPANGADGTAPYSGGVFRSDEVDGI